MGDTSGVSAIDLKIDAACERYESSRRSASPLSLASVLNSSDLPDVEKPRLFLELLLLELELRRGAGERPVAEDYLRRFPAFSREVAAGFAEGPPAADGSPVGAGEAITFGRFRFVGPIARGGLGTVSRVDDLILGREMALKEVRPDRDGPEPRARLAGEAQLNGRLEHPGVVPVYALGFHPDGRPFYVMRLVLGQELREAVDRFHGPAGAGPDAVGRPLALQDLLARFLAACDAIEYAHSKGVVHRDVKPANIMLGDFGETVVVDWGLAVAAGDSQEPPFSDKRSHLVGTPHYMSPEQANARDDDVGPLSDVYSLGATLYYVLTGRPPFGDSTTVGEVIRRVAAGDFPAPRRVRPQTPGALEAVCLKAMKVDPAGRYASARALGDDIRRWLADEPVSARPEPWIERVRRWATRHRVAAASAATAVLLALTVGLPLVASARSRAAGKVAALVTARAEALPGLVESLRGERGWVVPELRNRFRDPNLDRESKLRLALALDPSVPGVSGYLCERVFDAEFTLLPIICESLGEAPDRAQQVRRLREEFRTGDPSSDRPFRAAAAVSILEPKSEEDDAEVWNSRAATIVDGCVREVVDAPARLDAVAATFRPARRNLLPYLAALFRDVPRDEFVPAQALRRAIAAAILDRLVDWPEGLADLIPDTLPGPRRVRYFDQLRAMGTAGLDALERVFRRGEGGLPARDTPTGDPEAIVGDLTRRVSRVGSALVELGRPGPVLEALRGRGGFSLRTDLIHNLPASGPVALRAITDRLNVGEPDPSIRQALLLCLGEFDPKSIPRLDVKALAGRVETFYRADPDPGVHAAAGWLLATRWADPGGALRIVAVPRSRDPVPDRNWYVNAEGQTFAVIRGPVVARIGSPDGEAWRDRSETIREVAISKSFAVALHEVTFSEFRKFLDNREGESPHLDDPEFARLLRSDDGPVVGVNWSEAAEYCDWLSRREGLPRADWCYQGLAGKGGEASDDPTVAARTGYRLPTEAEWEFACRGGTTESRPFGTAWLWPFDHGWFPANSAGELHPVGRTMPNPFGLFDALGNAGEWTSDRFEAGGPPNVGPGGSRVVKGGSVLWPERPRSALRNGSLPSTHSPLVGFRVARTCP